MLLFYIHLVYCSNAVSGGVADDYDYDADGDDDGDRCCWYFRQTLCYYPPASRLHFSAVPFARSPAQWATATSAEGCRMTAPILPSMMFLRWLLGPKTWCLSLLDRIGMVWAMNRMWGERLACPVLVLLFVSAGMKEEKTDVERWWGVGEFSKDILRSILSQLELTRNGNRANVCTKTPIKLQFLKNK